MSNKEVMDLLSLYTEGILDLMSSGETPEGFGPAIDQKYPELRQHIATLYSKVYAKVNNL